MHRSWLQPQAAALAAALLLLSLLLPLPAPAAARPISTSSSNCPPAGFNSVANFDLDAYIAAPWYVQKQVPISFTGEDPTLLLYCVRAQYVPAEGTTTGGDNQPLVLRVLNYANAGRVNGPPAGTAGAADSGSGPGGANAPPVELVATPDPSARGTPTASSKLLVGPRFFLPGLLTTGKPLGFGRYWVVAVSPPSENATIAYDWAIISGGPPEFTAPDGAGCVTEAPPLPNPAEVGFGRWLAALRERAASRLQEAASGSSSGFWFFSRKPVDPEGTQQMEAAARALGYSLSGMVPVQQEGCLYSDTEQPAASG